MLHYLVRYIRHVRRQSHALKEVHALLFATVGTLLVVFLYVYVGSVSSEETDSGTAVVSASFSSPFTILMEQMRDVFTAAKMTGTVEVVNH